MKVTVCFGNVRVVVPCGRGDILVRDLTREAVLRYKKATGKGPDSWVSVHNLQSQGGGILDPDDRLSDVADDREQILASFEDGDGVHHGGGDGASGSSVGTGSPDIFHDGEHKYGPAYARTDIEVTGEQIASGAAGALQVRRGSEPALNQLPVGPPQNPEHTNKRWSAAPLILEPPNIAYHRERPEWGNNEDGQMNRSLDEGVGDGFRRLGRDGSNRLSMQFLGDGSGYRWAEAAERSAQNRASTSLPRESKRKEPLGQANVPPAAPHQMESVELIVIRNELGPLGIHVVPDYDRFGKDRGLLVQGIEPGKRIDRDGRLSIFDRIIEINGENLLNLPFQRVQEIFKLHLNSPELRLRVIKNSNLDSLRKPSGPRFPAEDNKENVSMVEGEQKQGTNTKVATVSPTKKVPAISKNLKSLLTANTRKIGRKIEIELLKGPHGLGFSITTRDNPAGGNCPIYIKNIIAKGAAVEDGRLKIGDRLLEVNGIEMTGKSQAEAASVLRNTIPGSKVRIVVSRQEDVLESALPRILDADLEKEAEMLNRPEENVAVADSPPTIPPLPQGHLQALQSNREKSQISNNSVAKIISQFQDVGSNCIEKSDEAMVFPWKHREILTFNIPVHDSEKAGLGISVKGKTSGSQDLGIFIKSVINGGAASRDKRLKTNDQLLNVNGISLLHQSNSDAMETLRKAMCHTEGPIPGNITLTIARRASSPGPHNRNYRNISDPNLIAPESSVSAEIFNSNSSDEPSQNSNNSGASGSSTNTVIFNPNHPLNGVEKGDKLGQMQTWNPVVDRLTGKNNQLRNESYYKATHDTWSSSMLAVGNNSFGNLTSTTLNMSPVNEPILIEDEYGSRVLTHQNSRINVHMTNKMNGNILAESRKDHEPDGKATIIPDSKSSDSNSQTAQTSDATYASQLSLENPQGFSRDAFGRQSMSEKRHATLDAKSTDTYQRTKKLREERKSTSKDGRYADKLGQLGPSLGMKKSSSLESLQTMVQEIQMQEEGDPAYSYRGPTGALKVIRGRGCEESFRAAVTDPNHQTEIGAKKHWLLDGPSEGEREIDGFSNVRGAPRQSSLNAALDSKHKSGKKKPGLFKGIGSMFRFGKHRKMDFNPAEHQQHYHPVHEFEHEEHPQRDHELLQQQQAEQSAILQREPLYQRHGGFVHRHAEQVQVIPENAVVENSPSKYRNNHLEVHHQKTRSAKPHDQRLRHSYYPGEDREPIYDQRNMYGEYGGRPGSRSGITESVPFTHYVNYNELQTHLSRKQHQYHSQRQARETHQQLRPVSNFYEYESIQSMLNNRPGGGRTNKNSNLPTPHYHHGQQEPNANLRPPPPIQVQGRHPNGRNNNHPSRGPFVTHVTIGESSPKNGTKV